MAALLSFVDSLASADSDDLRNLLKNNAPMSCQAAARELRTRLIAFDMGLITCQQLLETLVPPFIKLGRKAIQLQGTSAQGHLDVIAKCWCNQVTAVLAGDIVKDSHGVACFKIVVRPEKRLEVVKAMLKSDLVEVSLRMSWSINCRKSQQ